MTSWLFINAERCTSLSSIGSGNDASQLSFALFDASVFSSTLQWQFICGRGIRLFVIMSEDSYAKSNSTVCSFLKSIELHHEKSASLLGAVGPLFHT